MESTQFINKNFLELLLNTTQPVEIFLNPYVRSFQETIPLFSLFLVCKEY